MTISFAAVLVLTLIVGLIGWFELTSLTHSYRNLINERVNKILLIKDLKYMTTDQTKNVRGYLLTGICSSLTAI